jgi:Holliday junction resolvase RusA-like endonuclease
VILGKGESARAASIKSDKARAYEATATMQVPAAARVMLQGPVRFTAHIYYASERPDLDESVILDVMQAKYAKEKDGGALIRKGVYTNDRQVREKHVYHHIDRANPRAEIVVEAMVPQQVELDVKPPREEKEPF